MKNKATLLFLAFTLLLGSAQAKKVYIKLHGDDAWAHVTEDADNLIITMPEGNSALNSVMADVAADDVVWVAKGVYQLTGGIALNNDRAGVQLYGGFKGDETSLAQRAVKDMDANGMTEPWEFEFATQLKGVITDANIPATNTTWRLITANTPGVVVDGFILSDHDNRGDNGDASAAVFIKAAGDVTLRNSIIRNIAVSKVRDGALQGGAVQVDAQSGGKNVVENCLFENCLNENMSTTNSHAYGGAISVSGANGVIRNCVLRNNQTIGLGNANGGGIFLNGATAENCVLYNNEAEFRGGGIFVHSNAGAKVMNCTVVNNMIIRGTGGGMFNASSSLTCYNSIFWGNQHNEGLAPNNISMHTANKYTLDAFAYYGEERGGIWLLNDEGEVLNQVGTPATVLLNMYNTPAAGSLGDGAHPLFVNPTDYAGLALESFPEDVAALKKADFRLQEASPLIGKAVANDAVPATDLLGNARPNGSKADLGAYEYYKTSSGIATESANSYTFIRQGGGYEINGLQTEARVSVYSVDGSLLQTSTMTDGETITLPAQGMYLITVIEAGVSVTTKLTF